MEIHKLGLVYFSLQGKVKNLLTIFVKHEFLCTEKILKF